MGGSMPTRNDVSFEGFPKIPRLHRDIVVTEKIDGTNACIHILEDDRVLVGSRTRWITPEDDNYGFARWAREHEEELRKGLGYGKHHGEWWGSGINRNYGQQMKRFSLFNTSQWNQDNKPACCDVVPILYTGPFDTAVVDAALQELTKTGSRAAPGFMDPEGVVIFHVAACCYFKKTIKKDDERKGDKP